MAVISASTLRAELASGELTILDIRGLPLKRKWYVVYPVGKQLTPASKAFMEYLFNAANLLDHQQSHAIATSAGHLPPTT